MHRGRVVYRRTLLLLACLIAVLLLISCIFLIEVSNLDSCRDLKCHPNAECLVTDESVICTCSAGYYGDGATCDDIDECQLVVADSCPANSECFNVMGSFECLCQTGYFMTEDFVCEDVNECVEPGICHLDATCQNLFGTYVCKCNVDFKGNGILCDYIGDDEDCEIPVDNDYPNCYDRVQWLKQFWKSHSCYANYGVTGSVCSAIDFLSQIERSCPISQETDFLKNRRKDWADLDRFDNSVLLQLILGEEAAFTWIRKRISVLWNKLFAAYETLKQKQDFTKRIRKRILFYPGILAIRKWAWAEKAENGGPLGELMQWADLIAGSYLLGHDIYASSDIQGLKYRFPCDEDVSGIEHFDLIFTDTHGLDVIKKMGNKKIDKCKIRVLDSFGTEARFNYFKDDVENKLHLPADVNFAAPQMDGNFTDWILNLKQFMTMFPHSDDNTFLGVIVSNAEGKSHMMKKEDWALVYGKEDYMWKDCLRYLETFKDDFKVHATVAKLEKLNNVPDFVYNHGFLSSSDLQKLLQKSKVFIGLGFPFEGPAPLEAIANGAVFINPKFSEPYNREHDRIVNNERFFQYKPTLRKMTSQHPYMEHYVGKPLVHTVDMDNHTAIVEAIREIERDFATNTINPFLPHEFTNQGYLQRLNEIISKQSFCEGASIWPPEKALNVVVSRDHESCSQACSRKGFVCDNSLFNLTNTRSKFSDSGVLCSSYKNLRTLLAPYVAIETRTCVLQLEPLLYSCVDASAGCERVCPCRGFIKGQVALCPQCIRTF